MIYWYTGQPGHGKTLHAIQRAMEFKKQGRLVYVCNVRGFDYEKTGMEKMTPEQFRDWMNFLPDGAVCLVDEAYEHDMLPKRPPGSKVPAHVERLATHRHRGLDFIFVCQSPDKQVDGFVHDLIERHVHVRRRFGTKFVHQREFDRYERNPEKATPLVVRRGKLPTGPMGMYQSTEMDTTERRIPWYYIVFAIGLPGGLAFFYYAFSTMGERLGGGPQPAAVPPAVTTSKGGANGVTEPLGEGAPRRAADAEAYIASMTPAVPSQPWTASAYQGKLQLPQTPPRIFCMSSGRSEGERFIAEHCTCLTEQGTRYRLDIEVCATISRDGQYEPFLNERDSRYADGRDMQAKQREEAVQAAPVAVGSNSSFGEVASYGRDGLGAY